MYTIHTHADDGRLYFDLYRGKQLVLRTADGRLAEDVRRRLNRGSASMEMKRAVLSANSATALSEHT